MITYKISKGNWSSYELFNSIEEAELWTLNNLGQDYIVEISTDIILEPKTTEEKLQSKLQSDKQFGKYLIDTFLLDNRLIQPTVTPSESLQLLSEFNNIEKLANLGDIRSVQLLLTNITTDNRLFTQERKDKYLSLINGYLQN